MVLSNDHLEHRHNHVRSDDNKLLGKLADRDESFCWETVDEDDAEDKCRGEAEQKEEVAVAVDVVGWAG